MRKIQVLKTKPLRKAASKTTRQATQVFRHDTFYAAMAQDFMAAKGLILCQSPFLSIRKISELKPLLQSCINRGVRICVFAEEPREQPFNQSTDARKDTVGAAVTMLQEMGVHVTLRPKIHEKLIVIDEDVFWEGSLNPLSHNDTSERMTRWQDRDKVREAIFSHYLYGCLSCCMQDVQTAKDVWQMLNTIGSTLATRRKELGLLQEELATKSEISPSTVVALESGKRDVKISTLALLCAKLDMVVKIVPRYYGPKIDSLL